MKELIKITTNKDGSRLVDARELHEFLESKRKFADWIKYKINQYGFIENEDFTIHKFVNGKTIQIDYAITVNMAKELSMLEGNAKGKQARQYFIKCEDVAKQATKQLSPMEQLALFYEAIKEQKEDMQEVKEDIREIKEESPLNVVECQNLQSRVRGKGTKVLGGKISPAYKNNKLRGRVYADIQGQLRREFQVDKYAGIKRKHYDKALGMVDSYKAPIALKEEIDTLNDQLNFEV